MRTIIAKEPDKRILDIFQSNVNIQFTFVPIFTFSVLPINSIWFEDLKSGYFDWLIFTSFRSWQILMDQIAEKVVCIPDQTKIAVFGPASVEQIKQYKGRVDFTAQAHNATEFGLKFIKQLKLKQKIAYPASFTSSTQIEKSLSMCTVLVPILGYDRTAKIAYEAYESGKTIRELLLEKNILSKDEVEKILDPIKMTVPSK